VKKPSHHKPNDAAIIVAVLFAIAALAQCLSPTHGQSVQDACGGSGSHPVTIGGAMVVGCK
jgi:hypothetical protein